MVMLYPQDYADDNSNLDEHMLDQLKMILSESKTLAVDYHFSGTCILEDNKIIIYYLYNIHSYICLQIIDQLP